MMSLETRHAPQFASPRHLARALSRAIFGAAALLLMLAAIAHAGRYHAYSCRTPSGAAAPADGWSASTSEAFTNAGNTCATGGALIAGVEAGIERTANTALATWAFSAPPGATLAGATLWRASDADGGGAVNAFYQSWFAGPGDPLRRKCLWALRGWIYCPTGTGTTSQPLASENRLAVPAANLGSHLYMEASCSGLSGYECPVNAGDAHGYAAVAYLYAADLVLEQSEGPSSGGPTGPLATEQPVRGTSPLIFSATDPGAGIYEAIFTVDGHVVQETVVNENGGRCRNVGQTADGLPAFLYLQPCLKSVNADVGFDSTRVPTAYIT